MNSGEITVPSLYTGGKVLRLEWDNGVITKARTGGKSQSPNRWIFSPLLDIQVNGYGGVDFQSDSITSDDLHSAVRQLRRDGCAQIFLTLVTDAWPKLMARLKRLREYRVKSPELQSAIAGWHIEGPFMSHLPGFHGAHKPELMLDPKPEHIRELREVTGKDKVLLTVSPERPGAIKAIELASSLGIVISLGHTDASQEILLQAVKAGAKSFTHLGNGCPQQLDRHDNIIWRVLNTPDLLVGVIPDKIHVSPALFRIFFRHLGDRIWLTTDAVSPAGARPGRYRFGGIEFDVGPDQIVRQPGKTNFAGSALRPIDGVVRAAEMLGMPILKSGTWENLSKVPRDLFGIPTKLAVGDEATFNLVEFDKNGALKSAKVIFRGEETDVAVRHPYA